MLVLTRKQKEVIKIGENITVTIMRVHGQTVRIGIEAPRDVRVMRGELLAKDVAEAASITEDSGVLANESEVIEFRFTPEQSTSREQHIRGPLASFLSSLHSPGTVVEASAAVAQ